MIATDTPTRLERIARAGGWAALWALAYLPLIAGYWYVFNRTFNQTLQEASIIVFALLSLGIAAAAGLIHRSIIVALFTLLFGGILSGGVFGLWVALGGMAWDGGA